MIISTTLHISEYHIKLISLFVPYPISLIKTKHGPTFMVTKYKNESRRSRNRTIFSLILYSFGLFFNGFSHLCSPQLDRNVKVSSVFFAVGIPVALWTMLYSWHVHAGDIVTVLNMILVFERNHKKCKSYLFIFIHLMENE